jgi:bifunctional non-homologous end joining protein LigD
MSLRTYQQKRHFDRTPEPKGASRRSAGRSFVVQKHAASHLHYDFRLELDGVLKSWAVPKGPCLDPSVKRLAMQVEDHPVEYGSFEGIIPQGEYGGGTVMLWDQGEWEPIGDPDEGYRTGKLKFKLRGQKLHGGWMLVRTGMHKSSDSDRRQWLLFKERDEDARPMSDGDVLEEEPLSVVTGRNMPDIAADQDATWNVHSNGKPKRQTRTARTFSPLSSGAEGPGVRGRSRKLSARKPARRKAARLPASNDVELATRAAEAPDGADWVHEVKFDGYRILCQLDHGHVALMSRNHKDWTERFAAIADAARTLPVKQAILDGEIVALRSDGVSDFQALQNAIHDRRAGSLHYFLFDVLFLDGEDLTQQPLIERKQKLETLLNQKGIPVNFHYSEHIEGSGPDFLREACKRGLEGIVSKRRDRPYLPGRGTDWLKIKCVQTDEFVIGGYTNPAGERQGFGALLVGYHDTGGNLHYAGKVGTGFNDRTLKDLYRKVQGLEQQASPFADRLRLPRGTHWVAPQLVAQIAFGSRTREGILRHASFQGLREDKPADDVKQEKPQPLAKLLGDGKSHGTRSKRSEASADSGAYDRVKEQFAGVRLTSPDKVLYPEQGITKLELANYYRGIADWMLPHIADRPLVLVRCPEGREKECFYQKHPRQGTPENLRRIPIKEKTKFEDYVIADDAGGLISLAQIGALEIHAWGSRADKLELPDRLIFDLDPDPTVAWESVVDGARQVRDFLEQLGLTSFVKTTGGKGLHLVVPIERTHDWDEAKAFCKLVADAIVRADPDKFTANMAKAKRPNKIFVDYLRNGRGATAIVPYSPRARAGAPVSTPLTWQELSAKVRSDQYTIRNLFKRIKALKRDPWHAVGKTRQSLDEPIKTLRSLMT